MRYAVWFLGNFVKSYKFKWVANIHAWWNGGSVMYGEPGLYEVWIVDDDSKMMMTGHTEIVEASCYKELELVFKGKAILHVDYLGSKYECCKKGNCNDFRAK